MKFEIVIPEKLMPLKKYLVEQWDKFDNAFAKKLKTEHTTMRKKYDNHEMNSAEYSKWYRDFKKKYGLDNYDKEQYYLYESKEFRHEHNVKKADTLIINLVNRVTKKIGEIISWDNIFVSVENGYGLCLNGYVEGTLGKVRVESVEAGGYNIQRLHIRVLLKKW